VFNEKIILTPIGYIQTDSKGDEVREKSHHSKIIVNRTLDAALDGISGFSHLFVMFWLNQVKEEQRLMLKVHPRGRTDLPLTGVFAVRTMLRPNPIGLTLVELIAIEDNVLTVKGLDAYDGTPVLDIKPYDPWDIVESPRVPDWWLNLEKDKK
jgi:tRNA (adenine37-N6)-methyltransferase